MCYEIFTENRNREFLSDKNLKLRGYDFLAYSCYSSFKITHSIRKYMQIIQDGFSDLTKICLLRFKTHNLMLKNLSIGLSISELRFLDNHLSLLFKSIIQYDFYQALSNGKSLLVGEGNLSFSLSLALKLKNNHNIIASTFENHDELTDLTKDNAKHLSELGVNVMHGIDATKLDHSFKNIKFNKIIFQFPNAGSREPIDGQNPNYVLVKEFLEKAYLNLATLGSIIITCVDNDYYNNIFKLEELASVLGFDKPAKYKFDPENYPEYQHTMTHQEGSAIEQYKKFVTWEFKRCSN